MSRTLLISIKKIYSMIFTNLFDIYTKRCFTNIILSKKSFLNDPCKNMCWPHIFFCFFNTVGQTSLDYIYTSLESFAYLY